MSNSNGTVILFTPFGQRTNEKCSDIGYIDNKLVFYDCTNKRHITTLPYEVINEAI